MRSFSSEILKEETTCDTKP